MSQVLSPTLLVTSEVIKCEATAMFRQIVKGSRDRGSKDAMVVMEGGVPRCRVNIKGGSLDLKAAYRFTIT
jgi:hypothetical protein